VQRTAVGLHSARGQQQRTGRDAQREGLEPARVGTTAARRLRARQLRAGALETHLRLATVAARRHEPSRPEHRHLKLEPPPRQAATPRFLRRGGGWQPLWQRAHVE